MITFFTTTKKFTGQSRINQLNAIRSWLKAGPDTEVIVFGESEGLIEIVESLQITHVPEIELYNNQIPYINCMFGTVSKIARNEICCFVNADIILTRSFFNDVFSIHNKTKKDYLIVGQRHDVDVTAEINFEDANWEDAFRLSYGKSFSLHPPLGSDFFVFPKGQYTPENIPKLLVGRPAWDLWMIYNARKRKLSTIDLSFSSVVIHQNHDYSHKSENIKAREAEDQINRQFFKSGEWYIYTLYACNYCYVDGEIKKNYSRDNTKRFIKYENRLNGNQTFYMIRVKFEVMLIRLFAYVKTVVKL